MHNQILKEFQSSDVHRHSDKHEIMVLVKTREKTLNTHTLLRRFEVKRREKIII